MLAPFCHPTAVVLPAPGDELAAHPPCGSAGRPLVPSFACSGPRNSGDSAPIRFAWIPRPSIGINLTFLLVKQPNGTAVVRAEGVFLDF